MKKYLPFAGLLLLFACNLNTKPTTSMNNEQEYRPEFHFTPQANWMNDPNGMFYFNGTYHLYFQYYPNDNVWGPMHWGHATSQDLVHWKEQPIALYPDDMGYIFSGSAVVDHNNTSGFGEEGKTPIIALFTHHNMDKEKAKAIDVETQSIAYSLDEGFTWTKYEGNPVIANPGIRDFRDPKVIWDEERKQWVMVLAAHDRVQLYGSKNLKDWSFLSEFGQAQGHHGGVWECPDLIQLTPEGEKDPKWVLFVSINPGGPNGGSATQYFVGDFDGKTFALDETFEKQLNQDNNFWIDFGRDNYAGVTWQNTERRNGNKLFIGWMSNWDYAQKVPTTQWRSAMTVAREVGLSKTNQGYRLTSIPVSEIYDHYPLVELNEKTRLQNGSYSLEIPVSENKKTGYVLFNEKGEELQLGYDPQRKSYFVDRTKAGNIHFDEKFAHRVSFAPRLEENETAKAVLLLDKTSLELFFDDGKTVMTEIFFTTSPLTSVKSIN